jgi:hypothetical protein
MAVCWRWGQVQLPHPSTPPWPARCPQSSPVLQGLDDRHPYVRRTAVMGVLKIWHIDRVMVDNTGGWWGRLDVSAVT